MDQQLHDSSSFERAFAVAQQRHKETVTGLHRLREELRARDDVIKRLRASLGDRFDAELECRLLKDQLKKLQEGMQQVALEDNRRQHEVEMPVNDKNMQIDEGDATSRESSTSVATNQAMMKKAKNHVVKMPLEYLADILSCLDRFSLDRAGFTCPKLRAAVAMLDGQNLRSLGSLRLEVTWNEVTDDDWGTGCRSYTGRPAGGGEGLRSWDKVAAYSRGLHAQAENRFTIVVQCSSDPMALKNGVTHASGKTQCDFVDAPKATSHFVGLLRNATVRHMSLTNPYCHQFLQALSTADVDVTVGSLTIKCFTPEVANLAVGRDALMSFNRLEKLAIDDAPRDLLTDDFLIAATQKRVTSITLKSDHFRVRVGGGFGAGPTIVASVGHEYNYPELHEGLLAFLFRDDLEESAKVELRFPAARVPPDFCQHLMESAISAGTRYSIDALFVPVGDVNDDLVGFEEYRRLNDGHGNCVTYRVPDPNTTDIIVELKIATVAGVDWGAPTMDDWGAPTMDDWGAPTGDDWGAPTTEWKLVEFRRYRKDPPRARGTLSFLS